LSEAKETARGSYFLSRAAGLKRIRYIAKEIDDLWDRIKRRRGLVVFPVADRGLTDTKFFSNFFLKKL